MLLFLWFENIRYTGYILLIIETAYYKDKGNPVFNFIYFWRKKTKFCTTMMKY